MLRSAKGPWKCVRYNGGSLYLGSVPYNFIFLYVDRTGWRISFICGDFVIKGFVISGFHCTMYMEQNPDITNPCYNEQIFPVSWHFIILGFHCTEICVVSRIGCCSNLNFCMQVKLHCKQSLLSDVLTIEIFSFGELVSFPPRPNPRWRIRTVPIVIARAIRNNTRTTRALTSACRHLDTSCYFWKPRAQFNFQYLFLRLLLTHVPYEAWLSKKKMSVHIVSVSALIQYFTS